MHVRRPSPLAPGLVRALAAALVLVPALAPAAGAQGGPRGQGPAVGRGAARPPARPEGPNRPPLPEPAGLERGSYPTVYPQAADVRVEAGPAHQDEEGGCHQSVLSVAGARDGGFAAIFQDQRKGNFGLFLARLDAAGEPRHEQLPISDQVGTARELLPSVAAGPDGSGAVAWMKMAGRSAAQLRLFDADREAWSPTIPIGSPGYQRAVQAAVESGAPRAGARGGRAADDGAPQRATVAAGSDGRYAAAWLERDRVWLQTYRESRPEAPPQEIAGPQAAAVGGPRIAFAPEGARMLVAWDVEHGIAACAVTPRPPAPGRPAGLETALRAAGTGRLRDLETDPFGGAWAVVQEGERTGGRYVLRHLGADGAPDREDQPLAAGSVLGVDLQTWARGLAVCVERPGDVGAGEPRRIEIALLGPGGRAGTAEPLAIEASPRARGAFLAGEGLRAERLLVAWTDDGGTDSDVLFAFLAPAEEGAALGEPARWNDDEASSYQLHGSVASAGDRAVIAWTDERTGAGRIHVRRLDAEGAWVGDERAVGDPDPSRDRTMHRSSVALNDDGRFLVTWAESAAPRAPLALHGRAFGADGEPLGPPFRLDPGSAVAEGSAAGAVALGGNHGYVVAWVRAGVGPVARRVTLSGALEGEAWRLLDRASPDAANVELERISTGRLVCVFDEPGSPSSRVLTGRFLGPDARPEGEEIRFDWSGLGGDLDPELVATGDGGFLMSWTARDAPPRDVLARFFDAEGRPAGPPLGISTIANEQDFSDVARLSDGSFVVIWEDDLSGVDHAVARRIAEDRRTLGPIVMADPKVGTHIEVRHAPRVAPLGDGLVALWNDHGRSRGVDVFVRVLGPGFDGE